MRVKPTMSNAEMERATEDFFFFKGVSSVLNNFLLSFFFPRWIFFLLGNNNCTQKFGIFIFSLVMGNQTHKWLYLFVVFIFLNKFHEYATISWLFHFIQIMVQNKWRCVLLIGINSPKHLSAHYFVFRIIFLDISYLIFCYLSIAIWHRSYHCTLIIKIDYVIEILVYFNLV